MADLFTFLNSASPLGIAGLLGYIIYLLVKNQSVVKDNYTALTTNHLHELPDILEVLQRIERDQASAFSTIIAKLNGGFHK